MRSELPSPLTARLSAQLSAEALTPFPKDSDPVVQLQQNPCVTGYHRIPEREARWAELPSTVHPEIVGVLADAGITRLYSHQAACYENVRQGLNTVVLTPTASGKTLCYNLPVLQGILENPDRRALYLFPTKALTYDQLDDLIQWSDALPGEIRVHSYDGDTPQDARRAIRTRGHIVLTNPDMLHKGILPHHTKWVRIFENLDYVVIDELHTYRGVFGSHLANVLRRLDRICRFYGSAPRFICTSATIANPKQLAAGLTGKEFELIEDSGAPEGERHFFFYNPPVVNQHLGIRRSYVQETRRIAAEFLRRARGSIVFANSRLITEVLVRYLKEDLRPGVGEEDFVVGYRGGYLPRERRTIERGLREGRIRGVVATNALELGVDIGSLDVAILAGYPGTVASTWQRMGRAGRRTGSAIGVLVASSAPLDQYIVRHPDYFLGQSPESGLINPENIHILVSHLQCATFELPFGEDESFGGHDVGEIMSYLSERGFIHKAGSKWHWTRESYPADAISLRSVSSDNFLVVETTEATRIIGEVDYSSAFTTLHEKAIYLHQGQQFYVQQLDIAERRAYVKQVNSEYFTDAITYTQVRVLDTAESDRMHRHGEVHVAHQVVGFKKLKFATMENVGSGELSLPTQEMHTTAYWLAIPRDVYDPIPFSASARLDGVFGVAYALAAIAAVFLMCDRRDLGSSVQTGAEDTTPTPEGSPMTVRSLEHEPTIFIYDNYPAGIGLSRPLYEIRERVLLETRMLIGSCACEEGCPSCVGPFPGAKAPALAILDRLCSRGIPQETPAEDPIAT
jgi:DEAD/DEAH box helicase domain-containing protein